MNLNKFRQISINFKDQRSFGFTLLEIIITVGLIFFLTGAFVLTLRRSAGTAQLKDAAQQLQSEIRGAKNDAMSGKVDPGTGTVPKAKAIRLNATADNYDLRNYTDPFGSPNGIQERIINLPSGVTIERVNFNSTDTAWLHVIFNSPSGTAYIVPYDTLGNPLYENIVTWNTTDPNDIKPSDPPYVSGDAVIALKNDNNFRIEITVDYESGSVDVGNVQAP